VTIREFKTYSVEIAEKLPQDLYKPKEEPKKLDPKEEVPGKILDEEPVRPAPQTPQSRRTEPTQRTEATQPNYPPAPSQPPSITEPSPRETVRDKGILGIMSGKGESDRKATTGINPRSNVDLDKVMRPGTTLKKGSETSRISEGTTNEEMMGAREDQSAPKGIKRTALTKSGSIAPQTISQVSGEGSGSPGRSGTEIRQRLEGYLVPRLQHSYNKELQKNPNLTGKVSFSFTISANGRVTECRITRSTMNDSNFENKIVEQVKRCRFQPIDQGSVTVDWSIVFSRN
jgi:TonB family protein